MQIVYTNEKTYVFNSLHNICGKMDHGIQFKNIGSRQVKVKYRNEQKNSFFTIIDYLKLYKKVCDVKRREKTLRTKNQIALTI